MSVGAGPAGRAMAFGNICELKKMQRRGVRHVWLTAQQGVRAWNKGGQPCVANQLRV
jgi:hypothetical protein